MTTSEPSGSVFEYPVLCVFECVRVCVCATALASESWCDHQEEEEAVESGGQKGLLWHTRQQRSPDEGTSWCLSCQ